TEDHERAREDVSSLHGNPDGGPHVGMGHQISRAANYAVASEDVHRVVNNLTLQFGRIVLRHRRDHGRFCATVDSTACVAPGGLQDVRVPPDPAQRLLNSLETTDLQTELLSDGGMGGGDSECHLRAARALCGQ